MSREPGGTPADAEIRALIDDWARAVRAKDIDAVMRHYAADVVVSRIRSSTLERMR